MFRRMKPGKATLAVILVLGATIGLTLFSKAARVETSVIEKWVQRYDGPEGFPNDGERDMAVDSDGNVYVTGYSQGATSGNDYVTIKYDKHGNQAWGAGEAGVRRYNGPAHLSDVATAIAVDSDRNVYVTGSSVGFGTSSDYATIKYDSAGNQLWVQRYNGPGNGGDFARGIVVDSASNVYVTGYSFGSGTSSDFATIKYYGQTGEPMWKEGPGVDANGAARYNGPGNGNDAVTNIGLDADGNVYVTGMSWGSGTNYDFATIKYDSSGNPCWYLLNQPGVPPGTYSIAARYDGPGHGNDTPFCGHGTVFNRGIPVDSDGNVYVTGMSIGTRTNFDYATIKYNGQTGEPMWNLSDQPGTTIAYQGTPTSVNGKSIAARYNGPWNGSNMSLDIALDSENNVYVTGFSDGGVTNNDYATIAYNPNGDLLWTDPSIPGYHNGAIRYDGPGNGVDEAFNIAVWKDPSDGEDYVYVTGVSLGSGTSSDFATIKYWSRKDTTPPVITPTVTGTLGENGWFISSVNVTWQVIDPESGIAASNGCTPSTLASDTVSITVTCSATNGAGLSSSQSVTIKIDKTPPVISGLSVPSSLWPPNHKLVTVATVTANDALSGLASFSVTGTSNEPPNPGESDIVITGGGLQPCVIQLRAERLGTGTGRIYTLTATASDLAGNTTTVKTTVIVPHDQGK